MIWFYVETWEMIPRRPEIDEFIPTGKDGRMTLQLFLSATLRKQIPDYEPSHGILVERAAGMTIEDLCREMNIPVEKVKIIMVNGRSRGFNEILKGDERVALFPPVGGG